MGDDLSVEMKKFSSHVAELRTAFYRPDEEAEEIRRDHQDRAFAFGEA